MKISKFLSFLGITGIAMGLPQQRIQRGKNTQIRLPDSYRHVQPVQPDTEQKYSARFGPSGGREEFGGQGRVLKY